jgi:hypothetical protein
LVEKPVEKFMKVKNVSWFGLMTLVALPLQVGYGQSAGAPAATPTPAAQAPGNPGTAPASLSASVAEVVKLSKAGMGETVVMAYVKNSLFSYNLSANDILYLKDAGITSPVIAAMLDHDKALRDSAAPPAAYDPQPQPGAPGSQTQALQPATAAAPQPEASVGVAAPQTVAPATVIVSQTPPPAQVEVVTVCPGPDYYWAPGYWGWSGGWIWIGGGWRVGGGYRWGGFHGGGWGFHGGWGGHGGGHGGGGHR